MKATAEQIGNSTKERVFLNGVVYLKSVEIGRWNYIAQIRYEGEEFFRTGKSATRAAAEKWSPGVPGATFPIQPESAIRDHYNHIWPTMEDYKRDLREFKARPGVQKKRHRSGLTYYVQPLVIAERRVFKIER